MKGKRLNAKERWDKLRDEPGERARVFKELLKHVRSGFSLDCFELLGVNKIKELLDTCPQEFVREELDDAIREGKAFWEGVGRKQSLGECMGNSRSWYYNMANRYGWREKIDVEAEHKGTVNINVVSYASTKKPISTPED